MKQETSKNKKKWLLPVIIAAAVLVVAAIVLAFFMIPRGQNDTGAASSKLYWNLDRQEHLDPETGLSVRPAGSDGLYAIRFSVDGEHVELKCADKRLVNVIDAQNLMGLVFDADGLIVEVLNPADVATELAKEFYVKSFDGTTLILNSSIAMSGQNLSIPVTENTVIYDMSPKAQVIGAPGKELGTMDKVSVYGNEAGETTHVFRISVAVESDVYYRVDRFYNKTKKETSRVPDENGAYTIKFATKGQQVDLKCKNKNLVTQIDKAYDAGTQMGLVFDEEGYIVKTITAGEALKGHLPYKKWSVTAVDGNKISLESKFYSNSDIGETAEVVLPEGLEMYMMENGCDAEYIGEPTSELKVGDRIYLYTDFENNPLMVFVEMRKVDSEMYYNTTCMYDTTKQETTRVPENGYYVYEMAVGGKLKTYKTKSKEIANKIDSVANGCMGLKLNGSIIEDVYGSGCVCGYGTASNRMVTDVMGGIVRMVYFSDWTQGNNYMLAPDVQIYDITKNCNVPVGSVTELSPYDITSVIFLNENNQITHMYVTQRYIEDGVLVYHTDRQYNSTTKETARVPDADGYYVFEMMGNGKLMKIKTKDKSIADYMDYNKYPVTVRLSGDIIKGVYSPASCMKGGKVTMTGVTFQSMNANGTYNYLARNTLEPGTIRYPIADDCKIYNYSAVFQKYRGEKTTPRKGDLMYNVVSHEDSKIHIMLVIGGRESDEPIYWHVNRQWDATLQETKREPNADGWYIFEFAVSGQIKTFKTKDKSVATKADRRSGAFSIIRDGDIIIDVITYPNVKNVAAVTANGYTVTEINGNSFTATGSDVLKLKMAKGCYIYDVSANAKSFGAVAELAVGDVVYCLTNDDGDVVYIYITSKYKEAIAFELDGNAVNNDNLVFAEGTTNALCSVCNKEATWTAVTTDADITQPGHYYLANDIEVTDANGIKVVTEGVVCLHLNGNNISNNTESTGQCAVTCAGGVLNVLGKGTVHTKNKTKTGGAGAVLADCAGTTVNLCGGTYTNVDPGQSALGTRGGAVMKVYKGVSVSNGNLGINGDSTLEIYGGKFGCFFRAGTAGVGKLIVKDGTFNSPQAYLFNVVPATATITGGVFNQDPTAWVPEGCPVAKNGLVWYVGDAINDMPEIKPDTFDPATVVCEHCGVVPQGGWTAITANSVEEITADGHYYLKTDWAKASKAGIALPAYNICLHLNGHSITGGSTNGRALAISNGQTVNIMGNGTIDGTGTQGAIYCVKGTVNVYGGNLIAKEGEKVFHINGESADAAVVNVFNCVANGKLSVVSGTLKITGGTFNADPSAFVAAGYVANNNGDGTWTVAEGSGEPGGNEPGGNEPGGNEPGGEPEVFDPATSVCEHCGTAPAGGWTAITVNSADEITADGHYYLNTEWSKSSKAGLTLPAYNICLNLNGRTVSGTNTSGRTLSITGGQTVNIMGEGMVASAFTATTAGGAIYCTNGTVNVYGGTYTAGSASATVLTASGDTAAINIYGGTYTGIFYVKEGTATTYNIYGGTFTADPSAYVAEGYAATNNGDGTWTVAEISDEPGDEPKVFDPATSVCEHCGVAPEGGWIAITENSVDEITAAGHYYLNTEWSKDSKAGITLPAYNICLYLNGHTISGTNASGRALSIAGGQTVNIMGEGAVTSAFAKTTAGGAILVTNGTVNVYGGTYSAGSADAVVLTAAGDTAAINIYGGTYTGIFYVKEGATTTYNIYSGTFTADPSAYVAEGYAATNNGDGTWTVAEEVFDPATSICKHCGVAPQGGWIAITLSNRLDEITADGHYYLDVDWVNASKAGMELPAYNICLHLNGHSITGGGSNGRALSVSKGQTVNVMGDGVVTTTGTQGAVYCINGTVNLYGGTYGHTEKGVRVFHINGDNAVVNVYGGTYTGLSYVLKGTLNITDGTFSIDPDVNWNIGDDIRVYGGKFYFDPLAWVQEGYIVTDNGDGSWTVTQAPAVEA